MTVDAFAAAPPYVIAGAGPYAVPFDYGDAAELRVRIRTDAVTEVQLGLGFDFTLSPLGPAVAGALTLSAARAAAHAGQTLLIERHSAREQGWAGQGGAQEVGLEAQLDRIVRVLQELTAADLAFIADFNRTLRAPEIGATVGPLPTIANRAGRLLTFDVGGGPRAHDDQLTLVSGLNAGFATVPAAQAASVAAAVKRITVQGYADPADKGKADYVRVAAQPAHALRLRTQDRFLPDGSTNADDGGWWEIAEPVLRFEMGGVVQGVTGQTPAIQAVIDAHLQLSRPIHGDVGSVYWFEADVTCWGPPMISSPGQVVRGSKPGQWIIIREPMKFLFFNGSQFKVDTGEVQNGNSFVWGIKLKGITFEDAGDTPMPATRQDMLPKPLLESPRTSFTEFTDLYINGNYRRKVGAWFGRYDGIWNSKVHHCRFFRCGIGMISGGPKDHTDMEYTRNTWDQNIIAGAVIYNMQGGMVAYNSSENNFAAVGIYFAGSGGIPMRNPVVIGNYFFNNNAEMTGDFPAWMKGASGRADSCAIMVGDATRPLPYSDFTTEGVMDITSPDPVWAILIQSNYCVSGRTARAIICHGQRGSVIQGNTLQSVQTADHKHILIRGSGNTLVYGNYSQNQNVPDGVDADPALGWRAPLYRNPVTEAAVNFGANGINAGAVTADGDLTVFGAIDFASDLSGYTGKTTIRQIGFGPFSPGGGIPADTWTTIFDLEDGDHYMATLEISVERSDQTNKSYHWIKIARGGTDGAIVQHQFSPDPLPDSGGREIQIVGNALQIRSTFALALVGTVRAVGSPFAL